MDIRTADITYTLTEMHVILSFGSFMNISLVFMSETFTKTKQGNDG